MLFIFIPVTCIFSSQFSSFILPVSALAMALVNGPHALILVSIFVELDTEAFFAVIAPITNVLLTCLPLFALDRAVFCLILLLNPVDGAMGSIFLSFRIITTQEISVSQLQVMGRVI